MRMRSSLLLIAAGVFALVTVGFNSAAIAAPVTGAIFTTDQNSNFVNANIYETASSPDGSRTAPYLNGGPRPNAPCSSAGLPAGYYYFQVTDPSGKVLLSSDPIKNRRVNVAGGLIVGLIDDREPLTAPHDMGDGKCKNIAGYTNNITVELFPFYRTPNPGGEYKVWMTKDYVPCLINDNPNTRSTTPCQGSFGFIPSLSKTDNFKIVDYDDDGIPDAEDCSPDDPTPCTVTPPTVSIVLSSSGTIIEGGSATFTVTRTGDTGFDLIVNFTNSGTATLSSDYVLLDSSSNPLTDSVTIPAGQTTATITVTSVADLLPDGGFDSAGNAILVDETVTLTLDVNAAYTVGSPNSATITIADSPPPPPDCATDDFDCDGVPDSLDTCPGYIDADYFPNTPVPCPGVG
ncbi:MAG: hypothetical protein U1E51_15920 [Candidatus Binatia bacterium]|nr:hypothetical protein [Candidatus Binatia bacterium]